MCRCETEKKCEAKSTVGRGYSQLSSCRHCHALLRWQESRCASHPRISNPRHQASLHIKQFSTSNNPPPKQACTPSKPQHQQMEVHARHDLQHADGPEDALVDGDEEQYPHRALYIRLRAERPNHVNRKRRRRNILHQCFESMDTGRIRILHLFVARLLFECTLSCTGGSRAQNFL